MFYEPDKKPEHGKFKILKINHKKIPGDRDRWTIESEDLSTGEKVNLYTRKLWNFRTLSEGKKYYIDYYESGGSGGRLFRNIFMVGNEIRD